MKLLPPLGILIISVSSIILLPNFFQNEKSVTNYVFEEVQEVIASTEKEVEKYVHVKVPTFFDSNGNPVERNIPPQKTPEDVRGLYMTSWIASRPDLRTRIIQQIEDTPNLNSIIIDIKDDTGKISFKSEDPLLQEIGSTENRISDIDILLTELNEKGIYIIGRIAVFQDPFLIHVWPEEAVKKSSESEDLWLDRKKIGWIDPGSKKTWDYVATLAEESYKRGFDEINFDYIRFPSDGNMREIYYPLSSGKVKSEVMESFFQYIYERLEPQNIVTSADIFGMTAVNTDDLGIGQILEKTVPYFDYISPMVYPSHFPSGWAGISDPAGEPYAVIKKSMERAYERVVAMGEDPKKLRPWLQDFNLGAVYTSELVRAQIQALEDIGIYSWLMWSPRNVYTMSAFN